MKLTFTAGLALGFSLGLAIACGFMAALAADLRRRAPYAPRSAGGQIGSTER